MQQESQQPDSQLSSPNTKELHRSTDDYFDPIVLADRLLKFTDSKKFDWLFPDYVKLRRSQGPDRDRFFLRMIRRLRQATFADLGPDDDRF